MWPKVLSGPALEMRRTICISCPENKFGVCSACSCFIQAKTLISATNCPLNKWPYLKVENATPLNTTPKEIL